jgi:hypothetical protein
MELVDGQIKVSTSDWPSFANRRWSVLIFREGLQPGDVLAALRYHLSLRQPAVALR